MKPARVESPKEQSDCLEQWVLRRDGRKDSMKPWRKVKKIKEHIGRKGGRIFYLTLECGHTELRSNYQAANLWQRAKENRAAPKKVRCSLCDDKP